MGTEVARVTAVTILRGTASAGLVVALLLLAAALLVAYFSVRSSDRDPRMSGSDPPLDPPGDPQRYLVTVHSFDDQTTRYRVVTAAGSKKAASIAFDSHGRRDPEQDEQDEQDGARAAPPEEVRDIRVERLGAVELDRAGRVQFEDGDLFDRSEF